MFSSPSTPTLGVHPPVGSGRPVGLPKELLVGEEWRWLVSVQLRLSMKRERGGDGGSTPSHPSLVRGHPPLLIGG